MRAITAVGLVGLAALLAIESAKAGYGVLKTIPCLKKQPRIQQIAWHVGPPRPSSRAYDPLRAWQRPGTPRDEPPTGTYFPIERANAGFVVVEFRNGAEVSIGFMRTASGALANARLLGVLSPGDGDVVLSVLNVYMWWPGRGEPTRADYGAINRCIPLSAD
jgi:hypothetical protein